MKRNYETPNARVTLVCADDIITASSLLLTFSNQENAEIDRRDVHSFDSFFAN